MEQTNEAPPQEPFADAPCDLCGQRRWQWKIEQDPNPNLQGKYVCEPCLRKVK